MAYVVYGLKDPRTDELRYVGKSIMGTKRARQHAQPGFLRKDGNTYKANWIRELLSLGLEPLPVLLETVDGSPDDLYAAERRLIAFHRQSGARLTNLADYGPGPVGLKRSAESVKRSADARRGAKRSPEVIEKMRITSTGRRLPAEAIAKMRRGLTGLKRAPETRFRMSQSKMGHTVSPETRAKISASKRNNTRMSEETRRRMSAAKKGIPKSSETRANMSEGKRRWWAEKKRKAAEATGWPE